MRVACGVSVRKLSKAVCCSVGAEFFPLVGVQGRAPGRDTVLRESFPILQFVLLLPHPEAFSSLPGMV